MIPRLGQIAVVLVALGACNKDASRDADTVQRRFASPEEAATALIQATEQYNVPALVELLGSEGKALVSSQDSVMDRQIAAGFVAEARAGHRIELDSSGKTATLLVGKTDWPLAIPIVQDAGAWRFDAEAGADEILVRRIGQNELDAIQVCRGYVEAQREYALTRHDGARVNQYAQRIISTPGKRDGLAWQAADGSWEGPVGEAIARAIAEGYTKTPSPYHGYNFKVLKGQGPAAPLGEINFMVKGMMIGGFALAAAPAEYLVTGVKTFIVSHDGIVYEKDLGPETQERFRTMELYNPDSTWTPVAAN
jgi:Protein of unknown function (DUF2950)